MVRPPRRLQELQSVISSASSELSQSVQGSVDADVLAEYIGADPQDIREAITAGGCFAPTSLDADSTAGKLSAHHAVSMEEPGYELAEQIASVSEHCRGLSAQDRRLLALRYFDDKTQQEIAAEIGMSQMQVSRHLKRILSFLRDSVLTDAA
jgi:RNA polymerase sigma-B factor